MDCHDDDARAEYTQKISVLNDRLRREMPHGSVMITHTLSQLDNNKLREIASAIQAFEQFGPDNDPWGEHDFGQVEIDGEAYFWKIDAYDLNLEFASPDATEEAVTRRILTVMTAGVRPKALKVKVDDLNQTRSWSNHFGIDPIKFRRLQYGIADVVPMGFYIDKVPRSGKNRIERRNEPGNFMLMETLAGYRDELALRVFEGLSHIPITDAVFSVGDGKFVRKAWKTQLTDWHQATGSVLTVLRRLTSSLTFAV